MASAELGAVVSTRPGSDGPGSGRCCRRCRSPGLRSCGRRRRGGCSLRRGAGGQAGLLESRRHWKEATPEPPSEPEKPKLAWRCWSGRRVWSRSSCLGAVGVDAQGASPGSGRCCRPCRSPGLRSCGRRRRARCRARRGAGRQVGRSRGGTGRRRRRSPSVQRRRTGRGGGADRRRVAAIDRRLGRGGVDRPFEACAALWSALPACRSPALRSCGRRRRASCSWAASCRPPSRAGSAESRRHWKEATPEPPVLGAAEAEGGGGAVGQGAGVSVSLGVWGRWCRRPVEAGRARVGVAGGVDRPDLEAVGALGRGWRVVGGEVQEAKAGAVEAALEAGAGVGAGEARRSAVGSLVAPEGPESIVVWGAWCRAGCWRRGGRRRLVLATLSRARMSKL